MNKVLLVFLYACELLPFFLISICIKSARLHYNGLSVANKKKKLRHSRKCRIISLQWSKRGNERIPFLWYTNIMEIMKIIVTNAFGYNKIKGKFSLKMVVENFSGNTKSTHCKKKMYRFI